MNDTAKQTLLAFFGELPAPDEQLLFESVHRRLYQPGHAIAREGRKPNHMFLLLSGRVRLSKERPDGGQEMVAYIRPIAMFGHVSAFEMSTRLTTAAAMEPSECLLIPLRLFHPQIHAGSAMRLALRLRETALLAMNKQLRTMNTRLLSMASPGEMVDAMANDLGSWSLG